MILNFLEKRNKDDKDNNPPEDIDVYLEDEFNNLDDEVDDNEELEAEIFSKENYEIYLELKRMKSIIFLTSSRMVLCRCDVEKQLSVVMENKYGLEKIFIENERLLELSKI